MMINIAPNNPTLYNFLNPNNQATTSVNNGQTFAQPTASNQFGIVPPQAFPTMNPQSFSMPANGKMFEQQQGQIPLTGTPNAFQFANQASQPTAPASSWTDSLGLNGLNEFLTGANQYVATMPPSSAGASTTGILVNAPQQDLRQATTSQAPQQIAFILPEGFKASDLNNQETEEAQGSTEETPEIQGLRKSLNGLEEKVSYLKGTNGLDRSPEMNKKIQEFQNKVDALRTKIENLESNQPNNPQTALESKIDELTKKMDDLKKNNPKETASVPKKKPTVPTTVAKAPAPKTPA